MAMPAANVCGNATGWGIRAGAESTSDEMLISQMAAGHKAAMRILFARHKLKIYHFVLRIVRDAALAEDVVSETFIDIWRHADRYAGRSSVSTWLLGIARHRALTATRRRPTEPLDYEAARNVVDPASNPEAELGQKDTGAVLRGALTALSREHAEIIDLVYYQEKSIRESAEVLGIPENTVKTRMFYARKRLAAIVTAAGIDRDAA
jgi:RNA polymerase sigma-70 factor (ECF subfamily)